MIAFRPYADAFSDLISVTHYIFSDLISVIHYIFSDLISAIFHTFPIYFQPFSTFLPSVPLP